MDLVDMIEVETSQQGVRNLHNYCRTCGTVASTEELISIFDDRGLAYELNTKISAYLDIQVKESDSLPLNVCIECTTTLLSFHELYICCLKTKEHFNSIGLNENCSSLLENQENNSNLSKTPFISRKTIHVMNGRDNNLVDNMDHRDGNEPCTSTETDVVISPIFQQNSLCQYCTQRFQSKNDLIHHLKDIHTDLIFLCDVCKDYLPRSVLLSHMTSHAMSLEQSYFQNEEFQCEKCNKTFETDIKYQRHIKIAHRRLPKLFNCTYCGKIFKTNRVLTNHINHKHSNKRKYKCDLCQNCFKTDSGLYAHRKTHTEQYDYSCQICCKQFKFKKSLSRHQTMHSQEKNYFCRFCSKSFGVKDNLNKHLKTHYKLFEFKCHICQFLTSQRRYLAMHMKSSHLIKKS